MFPEIVRALAALKPHKFVLDGEIVVESDRTFSSDAVQRRLHPPESGVHALVEKMPASLLLFDVLVDTRGRDVTDRILAERRLALEEIARAHLVPNRQVRVSPATTERWVVSRWMTELRGRGFDGIIAKRLDKPYVAGDRSAMLKLKWLHTVDCVVGGFRYTPEEHVAGALLLGLYDSVGLLHYVGPCAIPPPVRPELTPRLERLVEPPGFGDPVPHRRDADWRPLRPALVCEVQYDHVSSGRFRHPAKLLRWRSDKSPEACTLTQLEQMDCGARASV
jgi:ATP-dependent DNA ligase